MRLVYTKLKPYCRTYRSLYRPIMNMHEQRNTHCLPAASRSSFEGAFERVLCRTPYGPHGFRSKVFVCVSEARTLSQKHGYEKTIVNICGPQQRAQAPGVAGSGYVRRVSLPPSLPSSWSLAKEAHEGPAYPWVTVLVSVCCLDGV